MTYTRIAKRFAVLSCGFLLAAGAVAQPSEDVYTIDEEFRDIAQAYPGFGGTFLDDEGVANIFVTPQADRSAITGVADGEVNFLPADFAWDELYTYREQLVDVMNEPNVVYLDIDERTNRVTIGVNEVDRGARTTRRDDMASRYGVPAKALAIVHSAPVERVVSLRDQRRPMPGGMQIEFPGFLCTLGFVIRQGSTRGFVTNSHCSGTQGGNQNTPFRQGGGPIIAREIRDPNYGNIAGCPAGRRCRRSDSSMARFTNNNGSLGQFARIARPTCRNCNNLTIASNGGSRFRITSNGNVGTGTVLHKVGRTTGWTSGRKVGSCQTTNVAGTNITLICQDRVRAGVNSGDSGSPVFQRTGGRNVRVTGILWGGGGGDFVYSPINQVRAELGNFSVN